MADRRSWSITLSLVLVLGFVNPLVEGLERSSSLLFMMSHYALFAAGLLFGSSLFRWRGRLWIIGAFFAVLWHTPQAFALSAGSTLLRAAEEATMFAGGLLTGSSAHSMAQRTKLTLIALWVAGDTLLSAIFIAAPQVYSDAPLSPYGSSGFPLTGFSMIVVMNAVLGYMIYDYVERVNRKLVEGSGDAVPCGGRA